MTFKSLFPLCRHVSVLPDHDSSAAANVRLILSDGRLRIFRRTFPAGELMSSHPLHLVCRSDQLFLGQKVPPLAAGDLLTAGQSYLLFPSSFFSSPLSLSSLASASPAKLLLLRPFEIRKTEQGKLQLRLSEEFLKKLEEEGEERKKEGMVCTTEKMEKEYLELVLKARIWKPKLETISELQGKGRCGFGGMRRKEKRLDFENRGGFN